MNELMLLTGLFLAQCVDKESDGTYNILLEQVGSSKYKSHNLVAHWTKDPEEFKIGKIYQLTVKAECTQVYEVLEGNGKRGSPWRAEDDWYLNGRPYTCNSIEVKYESVETLDNCSDFSRNCDICKG